MAKSALKSARRPGSFFCQHEQWHTSPAYRNLTCAARCLLQEFQLIHRPGRNGYLSISVNKAMVLLKVSKKTARRAFHELAEHGFLVLVKGEYWQERLAREWRLTIEPWNGREPTDDWQKWEAGAPLVVLPKKSPSPRAGGRK